MAGFTIAGSFLPTILQRKNIVIHKTLQETYRDYFIVYCPGILGVMLAIFLVKVPALGRKWTLVLSSMMMGVSLFLYSVVTTEASHVGFNAMEYFFQSLFNAVVSSRSLIYLGFRSQIFRAAIWMDTGSIPPRSERVCGGSCLILRWSVWRRRSSHRCTTLCSDQRKQFRALFCWEWCFCLYYMLDMHPIQIHGCL